MEPMQIASYFEAGYHKRNTNYFRVSFYMKL